ncbi:hypothetical protein FM107_12445 [Sphingobacterium sp. JB170]|nr:hypothetical protein FM107_12445 [Sphingobacterium sp. JB170]
MLKSNFQKLIKQSGYYETEPKLYHSFYFLGFPRGGNVGHIYVFPFI